MNKGFSNYRKEASELVGFSLKKKGAASTFTMSLYLLVSFLGKLIVFLRPIFVVADNNIMTMIDKNHNFSYLKAFEGTKNKYLSLLITYLVIDTMCLVPMLVVCLPALIAALPFNNVIGVIIFIIALLITLIIDIIICIRFTPVGYLATNTRDFGPGDYLYNSNATIKEIKGTVFNSVFLEALIAIFSLALVILPAIVFPVALSTVLGNNARWIGFVALIFAFLIYTLFGKALMTLKMSARLAIKDNALLKKTIVVRRLPGTKDKYEPVFLDEADERSALDITEDK